MSASDDPITRGAYEAGQQLVMASVDGLGAKVEAIKDSLVERLARVEAKQDTASNQHLEAAREAGRTDARLEALERQQSVDRRAASDRADEVENGAQKRADSQDLWIRGILLAVFTIGLGFVANVLLHAATP